ncbi:MAG: hypothetical protein WKF73_17165 [Nocardioidaceae bacterium]
MADLMTALNPLTGALYREGLEFTRLSREMVVILTGKYPHPQNVVPGGVSTTLTLQTLNEYHSRLGKIFDYAQRMMAVWDDIPAFFYEADERYQFVGYRPTNHIDPGYWDDPYAYDADVRELQRVGREALVDARRGPRRGARHDPAHRHQHRAARSSSSTPTTRSRTTSRYATDPLGNPISPYHPWNKRTLPKPGARDWKDKYTWATRAAVGPPGRRGRLLLAAAR